MEQDVKAQHIGEIIAGMTEAQKRWVLEAWYGPLGWQINYRKKACDLGLTEPRSSKLSDIGMEIRALLMEKRNDG